MSWSDQASCSDFKTGLRAVFICGVGAQDQVKRQQPQLAQLDAACDALRANLVTMQDKAATARLQAPTLRVSNRQGCLTNDECIQGMDDHVTCIKPACRLQVQKQSSSWGKRIHLSQRSIDYRNSSGCNVQCFCCMHGGASNVCGRGPIPIAFIITGMHGNGRQHRLT